VVESRVEPDPERHALYQRLMPVYAACEKHALDGTGDPERMLMDLALET
jgi:hypothetical protein